MASLATSATPGTPKRSAPAVAFDSPSSVAHIHGPASPDRPWGQRDPTACQSIKWLALTKDGLEIEEAATDALQQEPGYVNTVMVFGGLGTGM